MIIVSCPSCAMRFKMDEALIPTKGRVVRCSSCSHKWRLMHPDANKNDAVPPAPPLPSLYKEQKEPEAPKTRKTRPHRTGTIKSSLQSRLYIPFLVILFIWAMFFITLFFYPKSVVKYIPEMRGLYDAMGVKIEKTGLSLIQPFLEIKSNPDDNSDILIIRGTVMNTHPSQTLPLRPIRISLRDKANFIIQEFLMTQFETENLAPGGIEDFSYEVPNLPNNVIDVEIILVDE